jgi:hypothetical protein
MGKEVFPRPDSNARFPQPEESHYVCGGRFRNNLCKQADGPTDSIRVNKRNGDLSPTILLSHPQLHRFH